MTKLDLSRIKRFPVKGVCSVTGKRFLLIFHKKSSDTYYLERVIKTDADIDSDKSFSSSYTIKGNLFDEESIQFRCPYCGTTEKYDAMLVKCNVCGYIGCAGGLSIENNEPYYVCPVCGTGGFLGGDITNLDSGD